MQRNLSWGSLALVFSTFVMATPRTAVPPAFPSYLVPPERILKLEKRHLSKDMRVVGLELMTFGQFTSTYVHDNFPRMIVPQRTVVWVVKSAWRNGLKYPDGVKPAIALDVYDAADATFYTRRVVYQYTPYQMPLDRMMIQPAPSGLAGRAPHLAHRTYQ